MIDRTVTRNFLNEAWQRAYGGQPMGADHWYAIAGALNQDARFQAAEVAFRKAINLEPRRDDIRADLGENLRRQWKFDDAEAQLSGIQPSMRTRFIIGCLHLEKGESRKALEYLTPELCHEPWAQFIRSHALLHDKQWEEGFKYNEARLAVAPPLMTQVPMWEGESLEGKTLCVHSEQGHGDVICYSRFLHQLPKDGTVFFGVKSPMHRLMVDSFRETAIHVVNMNETLPKMDYWLPVMSLPHVLGIREIPPHNPYICPLGRFDVPRLPDTRLKVGLVWWSKASRQEAKKEVIIHGLQKSCPLEELLPLAAIPGVTLYSIQMNGAEDIRKLGAETLIVDLASRGQSFNDDALFMQEMDVILSVDTAGVHLAGAMGLDTLALLAVRGQWPFPNGDRSPWYPTIKCIRQPSPHDWTSVVRMAGDELRKRLAR